MSWEEAVRKLFQTHPRAVSSKTVIEAIKSASENTPPFTLTARDLAAEQNRSWNLGYDRGQQDERERIIKLIQEELGAWGDVNVGSVIALIKGENK